MMEVANRWADGEESMRNDRARSPGDDGDSNSNSERRNGRNMSLLSSPKATMEDSSVNATGNKSLKKNQYVSK